MGNPDWVGVLDAPAPTSGGSSNRFISRYPFAMRAPGAEGDVTARGSPTANPAEPSQLTANVEAKFAESSQKDHKAVDVGWYASEAQRRGFIGQQEGAAPSFAVTDRVAYLLTEFAFGPWWRAPSVPFFERGNRIVTTLPHSCARITTASPVHAPTTRNA